MNYKDYIGFKFSALKNILDENNEKYLVKEMWDTKNTKLGDDIRIVNIIVDSEIIIYVAYF